MNKARDPRLSLLAARVKEVVDRYDSDAEVVRLTGIPPNTVRRMRVGENEPLIFSVLTFAERLGFSFNWLIGLTDDPSETPPRDRPAADVVMVPILDVEAAAGGGIAVDVVKAEAEFAFPFYFLQKLLGDDAGRARLSSLRANGDSMEPTIMNRGLLIIDEAQKEFPAVPTNAKMRRAEPDIYVFFTSNGLRLKRLKPIDKNFAAIISDNIHGHPPEIFHHGTDGKISIVGKVIWWDNRL